MTLTLPRAHVWTASRDLCCSLLCEQGLLLSRCLWEVLCSLLVLPSLQAASWETSSSSPAFARAVICVTTQPNADISLTEGLQVWLWS